MFDRGMKEVLAGCVIVLMVAIALIYGVVGMVVELSRLILGRS